MAVLPLIGLGSPRDGVFSAATFPQGATPGKNTYGVYESWLAPFVPDVPTNLLPYEDATFDSTVGTWTAGTGTTSVSRSTTTPREGTGALAVLATGSGDSEARTAQGTGGVPVTAGQRYTVHVSVLGSKTAISGLFIQVPFWTSGGAGLSAQDNAWGNQISSNGWGDYTFEVVAPATAAYAAIIVRHGDGPTGTWRIDRAGFFAGSVRSIRWTPPTAISTTVTSGSVSSASTVTFSHTAVGTVLAVDVGYAVVGAPITSVTFNGTNLTRLGYESSGGGGSDRRIERWVLTSPPNVTANVVVTASFATSIAAVATSMTNVDTTTPFGTLVTNFGSGTSASVAATGPFLLSALAVRSATAPTPSGTQTEIASVLAGTNVYESVTTQVTSSPSWSWSTSDVWAALATGVNESAASALTQSVTDVAGSTDAVSVVRSIVSSVTDVAGNSDSLSTVGSFLRSVDDSAGSGDSVTIVRGIGQSATDDAGTTDSVATVGAFVRSVSDSAGTSDSVTAATTFVRTIDDSAGSTDTISVDRTLVIDDSAGTSDATSQSLTSAGNFAQSADDSAGSTDSTTFVGAFVRSVTDTAAGQDSVAISRGLVVSDTVGTTDSAALVVGVARTVGDVAGVVDSATTALTMPRSVDDAAGTSDNAATSRGVNSAPSDVAGVSDSVTISRGVSRSASDDAGSTDAVLLELIKAVEDGVGSTDNVFLDHVIFGLTSLAADDSAGTSDSITFQVITPSDITLTVDPAEVGDLTVTPRSATSSTGYDGGDYDSGEYDPQGVGALGIAPLSPNPTLVVNLIEPPAVGAVTVTTTSSGVSTDYDGAAYDSGEYDPEPLGTLTITVL